MNLRVLSRLSIATLIALMALGTVASLHIPDAHASGYVTPSLVQSLTHDEMNNTTGVISATLSYYTQPGDVIVALIGWGGGNSWSINSVSDTGGGMTALDDPSDPVTSVGHSDGIGDTVWGYIGPAPSASNTEETVTIDLTESGCPCGSSWLQTTITLFEVKLDNYAVSSYGYGARLALENGTGGTTHLVPSANETDQLNMALYLDGGANTIVTVPYGEMRQVTDSNTVNIEYAAGYTTNDTGPSNFEFDTGSSASYAAMVDVYIDDVQPVV